MISEQMTPQNLLVQMNIDRIFTQVIKCIELVTMKGNAKVRKYFVENMCKTMGTLRSLSGLQYSVTSHELSDRFSKMIHKNFRKQLNTQIDDAILEF